MAMKFASRLNTVKVLLKKFEMQDVEHILRLYSEDAVFTDPHYDPPIMKGKSEIRVGLEKAFQQIRKSDFKIRKFYGNKNSIVFLVNTKHQLLNSTVLEFSQVFIVEFNNSIIENMEVYLFNPPMSPPFIFRALKNWFLSRV